MSSESAVEYAVGAPTTCCTPRLRVFAATLLGDDDHMAEVMTGAASLCFDYGGTLIKAADPRQRFFRTTEDGTVQIERDTGAELAARCLIESFGVTEANCLGHATIDHDADYVIDTEADIHALATFSAYAVPKLRAQGIDVALAPDYPWQIVDANAAWYADINEGKRGWFSFELGIDIDGERQNLLPILLDILLSPKEGLDLETLASSPRRHVGLRFSRFRCLAISPQRLCNILRVLLELHQRHDAGNCRLYAHELQAAALVDLETAVAPGRLRLCGGEDVCRRARQLSTLGRDPAWTPAGLQAVLRPYQRQGLSWLTSLAEEQLGGILADDMGLGKTMQIIAHLLAEKATGRLSQPALVIAPTSVAGGWERELARFAPSLRVLRVSGSRRAALWQKAAGADVVLTTYPIILRDAATAAQLPLALAILDEAQTIKNKHSHIHQAVRSLQALRRLCLTGTPMENHLGELWALFDCVAPGLLGDAASFHATFAVPIEKTGNTELLAALRHRVAPFILRRQKKDVAKDLPPKTEIVWPVELTGEQRDLYETIRLAAHQQVRMAVSAQGIAGSTIAILDALMKLRQVCCDPRLLRLDAAHAVRRSAKYQVLFDLLTPQLAQGHRVLVFSQFTSMLALIARGLSERDIPHAILTGATIDRQRQIDTFQEHRVPVFLISLKAGGTGLTLTAADTVIHYDPWWNPAAQAQASDRAYRIGQLRPVFVYSLIVKGSVEERILALQQKKRALADSLLGTGAALQLSNDDVDELFAPIDRTVGPSA